MIRLTIQVPNIDDVMLLYTHTMIYTSSTELGTYTYLADVLLVAGQSTYTYNHLTGTTDTWYKSSYYNSDTSAESSLSDPVQGSVAELYHAPTYPPEFKFLSSELETIRKIRRYVGDFKGLRRLYIDESEETTSCSFIHEDRRTIELEEKGWPVYILLNDIEKTTLDDPIIQGYQYAVLSGTLTGTSNEIDIWYHTFKFSDRQIYQSFGDAMIPPGLTSTNVTQDHLVLQAAIDLLENMTAEDMVENGASIRDNETTYDPSPGLRERDLTIKRLQGMLDKLVKQYMMVGITGILLD